MNIIDPGFALEHDITPSPRGAKHIQVCHPYPLCPPLQGHNAPADRSDFTRDDESTGA
jgi:hypothetical protein